MTVCDDTLEGLFQAAEHTRTGLQVISTYGVISMATGKQAYYNPSTWLHRTPNTIKVMLSIRPNWISLRMSLLKYLMKTWLCSQSDEQWFDTRNQQLQSYLISQNGVAKLLKGSRILFVRQLTMSTLRCAVGLHSESGETITFRTVEPLCSLSTQWPPSRVRPIATEMLMRIMKMLTASYRRIALSLKRIFSNESIYFTLLHILSFYINISFTKLFLLLK